MVVTIRAEPWPESARSVTVHRCEGVGAVLYICTASLQCLLSHRGCTFLELKVTEQEKCLCLSFLSTLDLETLKDNPNHCSYFIDSETEAREVK